MAFLVLAALGAVALAIFRDRPPRPPALERGNEPLSEPSPKPRPSKTSKPSKAASPRDPTPTRPPPAATGAEVVAAAAKPLVPATPGTFRLALVIDDLGRSLADVERLEGLAVPVSYAVLPFESHTREVVAALRARQREVLCHLPMEPEGGSNPGPGALRLEMTSGDLGNATARALEAVPGAVGVNNHMGSRLSADRERMKTVLGVIAERGLFFLDSRTSAESVGYDTALGLGMASAERQVFLDRDPETAAVEAQFSRWLELARERGSAIAIGHPYASTFEVLAREVPKARAQGFEFVPVSFLMTDLGDAPQ